MYCPVDGHKDRGMEGTVAVGAGAAGGAGTTTDETTTEDPDYRGTSPRPRQHHSATRGNVVAPTPPGSNSRLMSDAASMALTPGRRMNRNWSTSGQPVTSQRPFGEKTTSSSRPSPRWSSSPARTIEALASLRVERSERDVPGPRRERRVEDVLTLRSSSVRPVRSSAGRVERMAPARGDDEEEPRIVGPDELVGGAPGSAAQSCSPSRPTTRTRPSMEA